MTLAKYYFRSYLRRGLGNLIQETDTLGQPLAGSNTGRPKIQGQMSIENASGIPAIDFPIVGPGDVLGFSPDMVIRTEPVHGNTNFQPNYLAHIEFYDEDMPWRYTPAKITADQKLRPWIFLLVLKEDEFGRSPEVTPLPRIKLTAKAILPPAAEIWAWAHVQEIAASSLQTDNNPDKIISRLICPRKLDENTPYRAFVVPAFESGRLAGLGKPETDNLPKKGINDVFAQMPAQWADSEGIPIYYEWNFHTGLAADFEYLAGLLKPNDADALVGRRLADFSEPGFGLPNIDGAWEQDTHFIEGALMSPNTQGLPATSLDLDDFGQQVRALINYSPGASGDPVVTLPFYGQKHKRMTTLAAYSDQNKWLAELNLQPRYRAAAGVGAEIIRKYQHDYMARAWEQLESIVAANKTIISAIASMNACQALYKNWIAPLSDEDFLAMTAPIHKKMVIPNPDYAGSHTPKEVTLFQAFRQSCYGSAVLNSSFRRITRRRGPWMKKLASKTDRQLSLHRLWSNVKDKRREIFTREINNIEHVATTDFQIVNPVLTILEVYDEINRGQAYEVVDFEGALARLANFIPSNVNAAPPCSENMPLKGAVEIIQQAVTPFNSFPALLQHIFPQLPFDEPEKIFPALAYPDFTDPMFEKLKEISLDWFIPNLHLLPHNSITLLEDNQPFIEAFMVGLNVEMCREMLWREYPTDDRGSCFRQFWDVKSIMPDVFPLPSNVVEDYKDIKPIHEWDNNTALGSHEQRPAAAGDNKLVLAIRGDLLKCYPNTAVYAQKSLKMANGKFVLETTDTIVIRLQELKDAINTASADVQKEIQKEIVTLEKDKNEIAQGKEINIKLPFFKSEIKGDLHFLGFDLSKEAARSTDATDAGWFFVFQEVPGETRFGLDLGELPAGSGTTAIQIENWDAISWALVGNPLILSTNKPNITVKTGTQDANIGWGDSAANMAYILYQKPVMIAIHADELILEEEVN